MNLLDEVFSLNLAINELTTLGQLLRRLPDQEDIKSGFHVLDQALERLRTLKFRETLLKRGVEALENIHEALATMQAPEAPEDSEDSELGIFARKLLPYSYEQGPIDGLLQAHPPVSRAEQDRRALAGKYAAMTSGVGNPEVMLASYVRRVLEAVREVAAGEPLEPADGDAPEPGEEEPL